MSDGDKRLANARLQAALKLQALCFDAANRVPGSFMNRDRAMDVVDAMVAVMLEAVNLYTTEENKKCK